MHGINIPTIFSYVNIAQYSFSSVLFILSVCLFIPVILHCAEELASLAKLQSSLFVGGFGGFIVGRVVWDDLGRFLQAVGRRKYST